MINKHLESPVSRQLTDTKGILKILGCSESTLNKLKKEGKIPFIKMGKVHRYDVEKAITALEVNTK